MMGANLKNWLALEKVGLAFSRQHTVHGKLVVQ